MIKLSGILQYSMGGFLCLRGFASFKMLSAISEPNPEIQRKLIEEHKGEMADFLNAGEYKFFPELILSLNLTDGKSDFDELASFHTNLQNGQTWNKSIGKVHFSVSQNKTKNVLGSYDLYPRIDCINIAHIKFDEKIIRLTRIDGNHRLSAADDVLYDFSVPFCLLLFRNVQENEQYSRAIFHNINAKQIPLSLEENLKVILESPDVFTDDKLKLDPSFGWKYYLSRKVLKNTDFTQYPSINSLIRGYECTYLLEEFDALIKVGLLDEDEKSVDTLINEFPSIELALQEANMKSLPHNLAVIGALTYYKLTDAAKQEQFVKWVVTNNISEAPGIHTEDLIEIFDKVYDSMPKSVFMSMQFSPETEDTFQTVKDVQAILKREDGIDFRIIKVDEHKDGYSAEIYHRIVDGIAEASLVIADLSYGNKNVHHEIGYAQGLNKKVLLLYKLREGIDPKNEIGSNISMHDQVRYKNQTELRPMLLKRIRHFFGIRHSDD
jgi:hypothetical protein